MKGRVTLLDRAKADLVNCKMALSQAETDELFQDIAAYHIQQSIEKAVKFWLTGLNVPPPRTHDMLVLIEALENEKQTIPEWLIKYRFLLNEYASKTRYSTSIVGTKREIKELCDYAAELIKKLEPMEITNTDEIKEAAINKTKVSKANV